MLTSIAESLLALLFPERCVGCKTPGALFCAVCRAALVLYPARELPPLPELDAMWVGYVFEGPLRNAIHQLKYRGRRRVVQPLGQLLAEQLPVRELPAPVVLPVPLHTARHAERGFNQAAELANYVALHLKLPVSPAGLTRVRATKQQAQLDAHERRANVAGAFAWRGATAPPPCVIIVDDVFTTGATIGACAQALRAAGTMQVYGAALARSR